MCDYSLQHVKSRSAKMGETLRTRQFNTGTLGFAAPEDANTAVCVLPGTELAFASAVRSNRFGWLGSASGSTLVAATTGLPNTPLIVEGLKSLRVQSCIIDGEAVWVIPSRGTSIIGVFFKRLSRQRLFRQFRQGICWRLLRGRSLFSFRRNLSVSSW